MITSPRNPRVAQALRLKKRAMRDESRRFLVEGAQAVAELIASETLVDVLFTTDASDPMALRAGDADVPVVHVSDAVMAKLTSTVTPQGLVAVAEFVDVGLETLAGDLGCVTILADCRDPGNAGTIVRSSDAAGADAVIFAGDSVDPFNAKAVRATSGSIFHLPVVRGADISGAVEALRGRGVRILAASADGDTDLFEEDLSGPVAFLFGNEAWGLPAEVATLADASVRIPIADRAESLNLAAAATVCLFEWRRQQGQSSAGPTRAPGSADRVGDLAGLIAAAAHDLRSPVAGAKSFASTLLHGVDAETQRALLEGIVYDADRADIVVHQLVDAARLVGDGVEPNAEDTDIGALVVDLAEVLLAIPEHPPVMWAGPPVEAPVDRARLKNALAAFIEAQVWWSSDGPIEVMGERTGGVVRIAVRRRGCDLTPEQAADLFRPRKAGEGGGSKLGMYVTQAVAESFGGRATATIDDGLVLAVEYPDIGEA